MAQDTTVDLADYMIQHHDRLLAYAEGRFGSRQQAREVVGDLMFYLYNFASPCPVSNPMRQVMEMLTRLALHREQLEQVRVSSGRGGAHSALARYRALRRSVPLPREALQHVRG